MVTHIDKICEVAVVEVSTEKLDASNANAFKDEVTPILKSTNSVVFDLSHLKLVDSTGLGTFLHCLRDLSSRGGELKLSGMNTKIRMLFEMVRMHRLFDIFPTREDAVRAF